MEIDSEIYALKTGNLLTITPKQYYQFKELKNAEGYILEFTYDFFCRDDKSLELVYHNGLYCHFALNEIIKTPDKESPDVIAAYFKTIKKEFANKQFEFEESLHSLLKLLLIEVSRYKILQQKRPLYTPDAPFLKFREVFKKNFRCNTVWPA